MEFRIPSLRGLKRQMPAHAMGRRGPDRYPQKTAGRLDQAAFADCRQPRLAGGAKRLAATFDDLCDLCVTIFLWVR